MMLSTQSKVQTTIKAQVPFLFHMTHRTNLDSILENGLFPHGNKFQKLDISNREVNCRRAMLEPINLKPIHSYVPFYFNPRNAMLYKTTMEYGNAIVILGYDNSLINTAIITDGNAANDCTRFGGISLLTQLNWQEIKSSSWYCDQERKRKMMAEALVPSPVSSKYLRRIYCKTMATKLLLSQHVYRHYPELNISVEFAPTLFF